MQKRFSISKGISWFVRTGVVCAFIFAIGIHSAHAQTSTTTAALQTQIDANNQQISDLNQKIAEYQAELTKVGADKKTLQAAINTLTLQRSTIETQISVTQHQIETTQLQIQELGLGVVSAQKEISQSQIGLEESFRELQIADDQSLLEQLLSAGNIAEQWSDVETIPQIQGAVAEKMRTLQDQKTNLSNLQNTTKQKQSALTLQKKSLTSQQASLFAAKQSKSELLTETNAQESKYQALLTAAKAQLASFSTFAQNAGGSGLLSNQTSCDSWGCYYNQRDTAWGNNALNGTMYRLASDGCLITAMAMVMTHYGFSDVTPQTINSDSSNFAAYYPAYLLHTITVDGKTVTRVVTTIDATLATGNPVVVGLHAYGGTHFVVLVSGKGGSYVMRDPYVANGKDIAFSDHYSLRDIYEINKVQISG